MSAGRRTHWGWHRLADRWAHRLVADSGVGPGDLVLDIGAGTGALTAALADAGARVVAFELHRGRAAALRDRFTGSSVTVVQADAADLRLPRRPFFVVANPPFAIARSVVHRLVAPRSRLIRADLIVPAYVAARWASPGAPGWHRWRHDFEARVGRRLPRSAFSPPAPHPVAVLRIERSRDSVCAIEPP